MNDFLEKLEIGEGKVKLSKEEIKAILAEHGKSVKTETDKVESKYKKDIETYKSTIDDLKAQIEGAPKSEELENLKQKISDFESKEAERLEQEKQAKADAILNKNIMDVFGDRKFSSDYAKNGLISDIKAEMKKEENQGKGIKDIFEELTKDKDGIFESPNKVVDMTPMGNIDSGLSKEAFQKMSYNERLELKREDPTLFKKYNEN